MRVLVTGGTGTVGSKVVRALLEVKGLPDVFEEDEILVTGGGVNA